MLGGFELAHLMKISYSICFPYLPIYTEDAVNALTEVSVTAYLSILTITAPGGR